MENQALKNAIEHLDKARTKTLVLKEFVPQYEQLTNSKLTGFEETLKEIDEQISQALVSVATQVKVTR